MAIRITEECLACGACLDVCPNGVIMEGDEIYSIGEDCDECKTCMDSCPVEAIIEE